LTGDADPVQVGDDLEYALRFGNRGATALLATQLALTLPAGTSVVDAGGGTAAAGTITWRLGALNARQTGEPRVRGHIDDLAPAATSGGASIRWRRGRAEACSSSSRSVATCRLRRSSRPRPACRMRLAHARAPG